MSKTSPYTYLGNRPLVVAPAAGLDSPLSVTVVEGSTRPPCSRRAASAMLSAASSWHRHPNVEHRDGVTAATITRRRPVSRTRSTATIVGDTERLDISYEPDVLTLVVP